jgi:hypothetical protein
MEATPRWDHPISGLSLRPELLSQGIEHLNQIQPPSGRIVGGPKANGSLERALTMPSKSATNRHQKLDKPAKLS